MHVQAGCVGKVAGIEALEEKATGVAKNLGFDEQNVGDGGRRSAHQNTFSVSKRSRY